MRRRRTPGQVTAVWPISNLSADCFECLWREAEGRCVSAADSGHALLSDQTGGVFHGFHR